MIKEILFGLALAAVICLGLVVGIQELTARERRISQLENAQAGCIPVREREIASAQYRDGRIECAISIPVGGRRTVVYRSTY